VQKHKGSTVPGRKTDRLGRINARETAARQETAERVATEQLEKQARTKGADAIVDFSVSFRRTGAGQECIVSGVAVKFKQ
jgi:uncharacterized protein YbjQ (UPF0145 family)